MSRAALLSGLAHGALGLALLVHVAPGPPPPPQYATVELIQQDTPSVGDGPVDSGQQDTAVPAAAPPPIPPTPSDQPSPPAPAAAAATPETVAPSVPMPPQPNQPPPVQQAMAARPKPAPPAPPPRPPQPDTQLPDGDPGGAPAIRLGDGGIAGTALVENAVPAALDSKVHNKEPVYPEAAARLGEEGTVILLVHVNVDGSAAAVDVQETSGYERLDQAARDAVTKWQFRPAQQGGVPVVSQMLVRVRFVIKG